MRAKVIDTLELKMQSANRALTGHQIAERINAPIIELKTQSRHTATLLDAARALADWMLAGSESPNTWNVDHMLYDEKHQLTNALRAMVSARLAERDEARS